MQVFVPLDWRSKLAAALFLTHSAVVDLNKNLCESKLFTTYIKKFLLIGSGKKVHFRCIFH